MPTGKWAPIIEGGDSRPYAEAIEEVARAVERVPTVATDWGPALLELYYGQSAGREDLLGRSAARINSAISALTQLRKTGLYGGMAGVGWLTAHYDRRLEQVAVPEAYEELDRALLAFTNPRHPHFHYDLISGVVGFGVYFLERQPSPVGRAGLELAVTTLLKSASRVGDTVTWHTHQSILPESHREMAPAGYFNVGVAHGVPGVVALLGEAWRLGIQGNEVKALTLGAIRWVLNQRRGDGSFPRWVTEQEASGKARVSWCYGGLGLSVSLLQAAEALGAEELREDILAIAEHESRQPIGSGVIDAGLCHGFSGNAHLFNRLFQATGRECFLLAARRWLDAALQFRRPGVGVGGYQSWQGRDRYWEDDATFLTGATGTALAFLAATTPEPPEWDSVLLCRC